KFAFPLETYQRRGPTLDADHFRALGSSEEGTGLAVGLPVHLNGREGQKAASARDFGEWLGQSNSLPVVYWDERFKTVVAESALWYVGLSHKQRKSRRDKVAAQILWQTYLDAGCPAAPMTAPIEGDPRS